MKIAISADSTLAITQKEAKNLGIHLIPLNVLVDGKEFHDDINITREELAMYMKNNKRISTSTPTPHEIETYFDKLFALGYDEIVHFTISSELSSIFNLFTLTCRNLYGDKVLVIDSHSVCHFMANHVLAAKAWLDEGLNKLEIAEKVKARIDSEYAVFIPENLTYLKRGGRVSPAVAVLGNLIGLRPLLTFENGKIGKKGATRNLRKSFIELLNDFNERGYTPQKYTIDILVFDALPKTLELVNTFFAENYPDYEIHHRPISINVCAHAGPGTIGIGFNLKHNATV